MKRRRMFLFALFIPALALAGVAACGQTEPDRSAAPLAVETKVQLVFDSGFLFVERESDGTMSAVMPKDLIGTPEHQRHSLSLEVASNMGTADKAGPWPLTGRVMTIAPQPSRLTVAKPEDKTPGQSPEDCSPIPGGDPEQANNLSYLPNLAELHPGTTLDLSPARIDTRIDLRGGTFGIRIAQGCWQLKKQNASLSPQSMVYGRDSAEYTATIGAPNLTITLRSLVDDSVVETITVTPNADGNIKLRAFHPPIEYEATKEGDPMADFARVYALLTPAVKEEDRYIPHLHKKQSEATSRPGTECGANLFTIASDTAPQLSR